jgi:hypothetical protein
LDETDEERPIKSDNGIFYPFSLGFIKKDTLISNMVTIFINEDKE